MLCKMKAIDLNLYGYWKVVNYKNGDHLKKINKYQ